MRTKLRSKVTLLFMTLGLVLALPAIALADTLIITNDITLATSNTNATKNPGDTGTAYARLDVTNGTPSGDTNGCNATGSAPLTVELTSDNPDVTFPSGNTAEITGCGVPVGVSYAVASGSQGGTAVISVDSYSGGRTDGTRTYLTTDTLTVTINPPPNSAPSKPGTPSGTTPNQGTFALNWTASTDDGKPAGSSVTYRLEHKDANDAGYSLVPGAGSLSANSFSFTAASPEAEGTWTYQVQASDGSLTSAFSDASSAIKVDKSNPNAPIVSADRVPDYNPAGTSNDWYKNTVDVSFAANGDPNLSDGSLGSGVDLSTVPATVTKDTSGSHTVNGTVKDIVGNESAAGSLTVQVDATTPTVQITGCPTGVVGFGSVHNITVAASDAHSGLANDPSGSVPLDTSQRGPQSAIVTATDNVGHSTQETCDYTVNRLPGDPGAPVLDNGSSSPNQGAFTLNWTASTDADNNLSHYVLQHKDADDAEFSDVATNLTTNSYTFPANSKEAEGTWTYRVKAVDSFNEESQYTSSVANLVKVDRTAPPAPTAIFSKSPEDAVGGWYKDQVTVSYNISTVPADPNLPDGSAGSGIASYTAAQLLNQPGANNYSGTATDNAGNVSAATSGSVNVDTQAPSVQFTSCPTAPVIKDSSASANWTASDPTPGSGLKTDASGSVTLDTSTVGQKTANAPVAEDKVGHTSTVASCTYSVIYNFSGFFQPIDNLDANGNYVLNKAKAGSTVPVKFSLGGDQGLNIFYTGDPTKVYPQVSAPFTCGSSSADLVEEYSTATTSGLKYDPVANQYIYNMKTDAKWAGTCRQLIVKLADGTTHRANFNFFK